MQIRRWSSLFIYTATVLLSISQTSYAAFNAGVSYSPQTFDSKLVDKPSFEVYGIDADYNIYKDIYPDIDLFLGSSFRYSSVSWKDNSQSRAGEALELTANIYAEWNNKVYFLYSGLRIPMYSSLQVGSTFKTTTSQGDFKSSTVTTYSGSGYELVGGAEYRIGKARHGKYMFRYSVGSEFLYVAKSYAVENTKINSSFSDYDGPLNHSFSVEGVAFSLFFKLRFTSFFGSR